MKLKKFIRTALAMLKCREALCMAILVALYWVGVALYLTFKRNAEIAMPIVGFVAFMLPICIGFCSVVLDNIREQSK